MQALFSLDSKFMQAMSRLCDLLILNLLFLLTCLPLFTIGTASSALYDVCFRMGTDREQGIFRTYFRAFRDNLKQGTLLWLLTALFGAAICLNLLLFYSMGGTLHFAGLLFAGLLLALLVMAGSYIPPLLSRFDNDMLSTFKNALILSIAYLPRSVVIGALNIFPLVLMLLNLYTFLQAGLIWIFLYFSAAAYLNTFLLKKVFAPYLENEEESQ